MYEKLTSFIDTFEGMTDYGQYTGWVEELEDGHKCFRAGVIDYNDDINAFVYAVYDGFADSEYMQTINRLMNESNTDSAYEIDTSGLTAAEILACLTGTVKAERFCDGVLAEALHSGFITSCLKRLRELDTATS